MRLDPNKSVTAVGAGLHASESVAAAAPPIAGTSLASILTRHILRDGELVLLILKPSKWFIVLSSWRFIVLIALIVALGALVEDRSGIKPVVCYSLGTVAIALRLMWAVLQWMGRLYMLTDLRIVSLSGVFNVEIFDCPLRQVARTRIASPLRERIFLRGTIEIVPRDETMWPTAWQTIVRPREIHEQIRAAIDRARRFERAFGLE
jgi:hypothetical protein